MKKITGIMEKMCIRDRCEQLIDIYMAENDETESKITAQIKTKIILLQFILEMWKKRCV